MLLIIILLGVPSCLTQLLYPTEAHYLLFGDLVNMQESFLPEKGEKLEEPFDKNAPKITLREALSDAYMLKSFDEIVDSFKKPESGPKSFLHKEMEDINAVVHNISTTVLTPMRRSWHRDVHWSAIYTNDHFDRYRSNAREVRKLRKMYMVCMQFLVHTRHFVDGAMQQRLLVRDDKRFKIGYLFFRIRQLKSDMLKLIRNVKYQGYKVVDRRFHSALKVYEEVIRIDIDIRDTLNTIKKLYDKTEEYDVMPDPNAPKAPGSAAPPPDAAGGLPGAPPPGSPPAPAAG